MDAQFLHRAYSRSDFSRFLEHFLPDDFLPEEQSLNPSYGFTPKFITTVTRLGKCPSLELEVFEVHHTSLHDARVGISRDAFQLLQHCSMSNRALMAFVPASGEQWRFSLMEMTAELNDTTLRVCRSYSNPRRFSFLLGTDAKTKTPEQYLIGKGNIRIRTENSKTLSPWEDLKSRFSVEVLSDEFFERYREYYANFVQFVTGKRFVKQDNKWVEKCFSAPNEELMQIFNGDEKKVRDYVKKMMGRITFLHFLQRKGWMKGDSNYMQNLFIQSEQQENYLEAVLEPLFFGILNTKPQERDTLFATKGWDRLLLNKWNDIPYLNGGLFECDDNDLLKCTFPSNYFSNLFAFFTEYNFTIDENDPNDAEIGVDPEMLGKIFENLLEDNKDKGAFYTPKEIVQYMCQEALISYLETETALSKEMIRLFVQSPENNVNNIPETEQEKLRKSLECVKICDPAIGSGAFPMELLNELLHCREALIEGSYNRAEIKKSIIQNNIYGVDIEQGAVDIARLRFWLSIVVDEDTPSPLPNLDYKIMNGNSLLTTFNGKYLNINDNQKHANIQAIIAKKKSLQQLQKDYFLLSGQSKYEQEILIKNLILDIIDLQLGYERNSFAIKQIQTGNLFGEDTPKQMSLAEITKQKAPEKQDTLDYCKALRETIKDTTKSIEERARTKIPFFDWHIMFADVFNRPSKQGFDIIIGNPPYIQLQNNGGELATMYAPCEFETFARTGDIYCLFYEQGNKLLHDGGHLCYITSNKWMRAGYGEKTREFFAKHTNPKLLIDFAGVKIFDSATVDTNILLFQKAKNAQSTTCCVTKKLDKEGVKNLSDFVLLNSTQCAFTTSDSWVILSPIEQSIKRKIEAVGKPLKDWDINIYRGVLTGYNEAFIISTEKRNEILAACQTEDERKRTAELIRPILRGRDIKRYGYDWAGLWLINTHNGVKGKYPPIDINDYPAIKQHLDKYWDKISTRDDKGVTPYNLRNCAYLDDFNKAKIIWGEISDRSKFSYEGNGIFIPEATTFLMVGEHLPYLLCVLNSPLSEWFFSKLGTTTGVGTIRWKKYTIQELKIPKVTKQEEVFFEKYVKKYIAEEINLEYFTNIVNKKIYTIVGLSNMEELYVENFYPPML